jgi:RNA binding exosome subunit
MYIDISEDLKREIDDRVENATIYNGDIYRLTETKEGKYGNHGDIIKYIDEEVNTLDDIKVVLKALINGLNRVA